MSALLFPDGLRGVIFDCDGVMIDSRAANDEFYNRVLAYFGLPPMTPEPRRPILSWLPRGRPYGTFCRNVCTARLTV